MRTHQRRTFSVSLLGLTLAIVLIVAYLPGWVPALASSIRDGTVAWLLTRAGGFVAYGLLWLSVVFGLLMTSKVARSWPGVKQANAVHRAVSALALFYALGHALVLLGDATMSFNLWTLLVPFTAAVYRPVALGLGQIGLILLVIVLISTYARHRIGARTWRVLHTAAFVLYYLVTAHSLLAGTDSREPWALALYISTGLLTYALTVYRVLVTTAPPLKETQPDVARFVPRHDPAGGR